MRKDIKITFIGSGNMASCLIYGLINAGHSCEYICATSPENTHLKVLKEKLQIQTTHDNIVGAKSADVVVLAVKPQVGEKVVKELATTLANNKALVVSIMAGISLAKIESWLGHNAAIVRTMPNIPSLVGCGATVMYANKQVTIEQRDLAESLMRSVGSVWWLQQEKQIDIATAVASSGPAYFYALMEAMVQAGIDNGLSAELTRELVLQTALGSANLALAENIDLAQLRQRVTSPGGGTEQAIKVFEEQHFKQIVIAAIEKALQRYKELN